MFSLIYALLVAVPAIFTPGHVHAAQTAIAQADQRVLNHLVATPRLIPATTLTQSYIRVHRYDGAQQPQKRSMYTLRLAGGRVIHVVVPRKLGGQLMPGEHVLVSYHRGRPSIIEPDGTISARGFHDYPYLAIARVRRVRLFRSRSHTSARVATVHTRYMMPLSREVLTGSPVHVGDRVALVYRSDDSPAELVALDRKAAATSRARILHGVVNHISVDHPAHGAPYRTVSVHVPKKPYLRLAFPRPDVPVHVGEHVVVTSRKPGLQVVRLRVPQHQNSSGGAK